MPIDVRFENNNARLKPIINPLMKSKYETNIHWRNIDAALAGYEQDYGLVELNPDFQRGHVWTENQQISFIENHLRGALPSSTYVIQFNCPNWDNYNYNGELPRGFQCIDGLQRMTAIKRFLSGEIKVFGTLACEDLNYSSFAIGSTTCITFAVYCFTRKRDLLEHYLAFNAGGTPHSEEEINRVRKMITQTTRKEQC